MDENKWEYDYSSSNNPAGDTGYPNVGSSGMNTANTASTFSESTQPSGGATPPPAGPQNTAPAAPKKPKKNAGKAVKSIVALVLAAAMGFMGGFVGARFGGNNKVIIQQVERSDSSSADSESAAEGTTVSSGMTTAQVAKTVSPSVVVITTEQVVYSQWSWYGQSQVESGAGSGVIISSDGYILTCDHVVSGASNITVTIGDKDYTATVVGEDSTSDIAVISAHTNLDIAQGGVNDLLAKRIGLSDCRGLQPMDAQGTFFLGRVGSLPEGMEPQQFAQYLKQRLGAPSVKFAAADRTVKTVALCGGAGADCLEDAIRVGADALLTSEVKQHEYLAAAAAGISIFDAGHFDTEDVVIEPLWEYLTKQFADVEFFTTHHTVIRAV